MVTISDALTLLGRPVVLAILSSTLLPITSYLAVDHVVTGRTLEELQATVDRESHVEVGSSIPFLTGFSLTGERLQLSASRHGRPALVLGLSGSCAYCLGDLDLHHQLASEASDRGLEVYWVLRDSLDEARQGPYVRGAAPGSLLVEPVNATYRQVGLSFTPQTIVLNSEGRVDDSWRGVLGATGEARMREAIRRVTLPQTESKH